MADNAPHPEHYHSLLAPITSAIERFEHTKTGAQVFRFARLFVVGVATAYLTHSAVDAASVVAIAEVAFRQVWPPSQ